MLVQRDTYFRVARRPAEAARGEPGRRGADPVPTGPTRPRRARAATGSRPSRTPTRCARRSTPRSARSSSSTRSAGCCCGRACASTSTRVEGLGSFVELEGVAPAGLGPRGRAREGRAAAARRSASTDRILADSYSDRLLAAADGDLVAAGARAVDGAARYAPYSRYHVGAALRAEDGSIHAGANVENAAYPQGQCAEASAIGALVAAGRTRIARGGRDRRRRRAVRAVRRLPPAAARVHAARRAPSTCASATRSARTVDPRELLPMSFGPEFLPRMTARRSPSGPASAALGIILGSGLGGLADALEDASRSPTASCPDFPEPGVAGHGGRLVLGTLGGLPVACLQGRRHVYEGGDPGAMRAPGARAQGAPAPRRCSSPTPPARCDADVAARLADGDQPTTSTCSASTRSPGPTTTTSARASRACATPTTRRCAALLRDARRPRSGSRCRGRLPRHRTARASRPRPRSARSARSAPTPSACRPCPRSSSPATAACASPPSRRSPTSPRAWAARRSRTSRRCATPTLAAGDLDPAGHRVLRGAGRLMLARRGHPPQARRPRRCRRGDRVPRRRDRRRLAVGRPGRRARDGAVPARDGARRARRADRGDARLGHRPGVGPRPARARQALDRRRRRQGDA